MNMDLSKLYEKIKELYVKYLQTGLSISNPIIAEERKNLYKNIKYNALWHEPFIEYIPKYIEYKSISECAKELQCYNKFDEFIIASKLFNEDMKLYKHQYNSLKEVMNKKHVVITTGTSSGKTESFILPMYYNLLKSHMVQNDETCIKSLIIYPLNALVEDQLIRLRKTLNSEQIKKWYINNNIKPITFARYNGRTPEYIEDIYKITWDNVKYSRCKDVATCIECDYGKELCKNIYYYQNTDIDSTELLSREQIHNDTPDILITNYSMLNILGMRKKGQELFKKTKKWLENNNNVFTLILDELHTYRGTSGTEIMYSIRMFLHYIGLDAYSPQLRIICTSASFENERTTKKYLCEFFNIKEVDFDKKFSLISNNDSVLKIPVKSYEPLHKEDLYNINNNDFIKKYDIEKRLLSCLYNNDDKMIPQTISYLSKHILRETETKYMEQIINNIALQDDFKIRIHFLLKTAGNLWACSNPECTEEKREIGRLYSKPRFTCEHCGSRVLEVNICRTCGEIYLAGYTYDDNGKKLSPYKMDENSNKVLLHYIVEEKENYNNWYKITYDNKNGSLKKVVGDSNYYISEIEGPQCIICQADKNGNNKQEEVGKNKKKANITTITPHSISVQKMSQILADNIADEILDESKLIVFSDSRQACAKLSAGVEGNHYYDVLRTLLVYNIQKLVQEKEDIKTIIKKIYSNENIDDESFDKIQDYFYKKSELNLCKRLTREEMSKLYNNTLDEEAFNNIINRLPTNYQLLEAIENLFDYMIDMGINPAGPYPSLQLIKSGTGEKIKWFNVKKLQYEEQRPLREPFKKNILDILFAGRNLSFESLGLGIIRIKNNALLDSFKDNFLSSCLRIIGEIKLKYIKSFKTQIEKKIELYISNVSKNNNITKGQLYDLYQSTFNVNTGIIDVDYNIDVTNNLFIEVPNNKELYVCEVCNTVHMHDTCGICVHCFSNRINKKNYEVLKDNYYLALLEKEPKRLHCEELSGQTSVKDSLTRQRHFQGIYNNEEKGFAKYYEIDLLSVTTTMEAGVDIGDLKAVLLSGVPPKRFNYQQRVGRAGRRKDPISIAITIANSSNHDITHYNEPQRLISYPIPDPYLDINSIAIAKRVISKEVLRLAFNTFTKQDNMKDIHGNFGNITEWSNNKVKVNEYISNNSTEIKNLIQSICIVEIRNDILIYIQNDLVKEIDKKCKEAEFDDSLSLYLANKGVLPLYGFPSTIRNLFININDSKKSINTTKFKEGHYSIERNHIQALSYYSLGAETIKDKFVYKTIGFAYPYLKGNEIVWHDTPEGKEYYISECSICGYFIKDAKEICPSCGNKLDKYKAYSPLGYFADPREDYRGQDSSKKLTCETQVATPNIVIDNNIKINCSYIYTSGDLYTINTNNGRYFELERADNGVTKLKDGNKNKAKTVLFANVHTDILLIGLKQIPSNILTNTKYEKTAYRSWAELIKKAAIRFLDIDTSEIDAGIRIYEKNKEIYLADTLENGAGITKYLAQDDVFEKFIRECYFENNTISLKEFYDKHDCDTACYDCIADYNNKFEFGLLNWRLGLDMLNLSFNDEFMIDLIKPYWNTLIEKYFKNKYLIEKNNIIIDNKLITHPLWNDNYINEQKIKMDISDSIDIYNLIFMSK